MAERWAYDARHLTAVAEVLKARFNNLTVAETIKLTVAVMDAVKTVENDVRETV